MVLNGFCCTAPRNPRPPANGAPVDLSQFTLMRTIGQGSCACVRVVQRVTTRGLYALKVIDKARAARTGTIASVLQERRILEELSHNFVVNMYWAFQDTTNCYLLLDLMLGGSLRFQVLRRGSLGENAVRFCVAEISSALAYLHQNGICHRDVKPENILLDYQGHASLSDFNTAIHYSEKTYHTAIAGTMVYMAPEMLARTGYSWPIDYWSLGVTAYECLFYGRRPFAHGSKDVARVTDAIINDPLGFPDTDICSQEGIAALSALMERNSVQRLGCKGYSRRRGQAQLRQHPWFRGLDWDRLENGEVAPPFVPGDDWNFEDFRAGQDGTLRARINRLSNLSEKVSTAQLYLEKHFMPFDFEQMPRRVYRFMRGDAEEADRANVAVVPQRESMVGAVRTSTRKISSDAGHSSGNSTLL